MELKNFSNSGAVLIFDEITGGSECVLEDYPKYGVNRDIAIFAKSIANGYAMACVIGIQEHMNASQKTFMSSTNWTERIGPAAAIATIKKYQKEKVYNKIIKTGNQVKKIWQRSSYKHSLDISVSGLPTLASFAFNYPKNQELMTYFTIKMLELGFLGYRQFKPSYAHSFINLDDYEKSVDEIFYLISTNKWEMKLILLQLILVSNV